MKRRNVQQAFIGEGEPAAEGIESLVEGDEAVDIEVRSGKIMIVVPAGTSDEDLMDRRRLLGGELVLEDGSVLSFSIEDAAVGAQASLNPPRKDDHPGLSSIPNVPGGV